MQAMIILMIQRILAAIIGPKMLIFVLKAVATRTTNSIDDNVVLIVDGAVNNDEAKIVTGCQQLVEIASDLVKEATENK